MRPVRLTIEGLACFKDRQEIDFADLELFPKDDGSFKKSQTSLTVGLVVAFGGKI